MLTRIVVGVVAALFAVGMLAIRFTPVFPIVVAFFCRYGRIRARESYRCQKQSDTYYKSYICRYYTALLRL